MHSKSARVLMKYFVVQWLWGRVATHQIEVSKPFKNDSKCNISNYIPGVSTSFIATRILIFFFQKIRQIEGIFAMLSLNVN